MYDIYSNGRLVETGVSYRKAEIYREFIPNMEARDAEMDVDLPPDEELSELYGVRDKRVMDSALIVCACVVGSGLFLCLAILTQ